MAQEKKAAAPKAAAIKKVIVYTAEDNSKYELKGNAFCFKGQEHTAKEAVKNEALMIALIASGSPSIEKV